MTQPPDDDDEPVRSPYTHPGDIGVIILAACCTLIFVGLLFVHWSGPPPGLTPQAAPQAAPQAKPETDMSLYPAAPAKKP